MQPKLKLFSKYRPRVLTFIVLLVATGILALANLSEGVTSGGFLTNLSYGWPFVCRRYTVVIADIQIGISETYYSAGGFAGNVAIGLIILAACGVICEWLLRYYRPRLRWSLRTMLAVVGLAAACCGWLAAARNRANGQDSLIAAIEARRGTVWVERWGPNWLNLIGADRFRREIVGAQLWVYSDDDQEAVEDILPRLARLPKFQYLILDAVVTAPMADALVEMRHLRLLSVPASATADNQQYCIPAVGKLTKLEYLHLHDSPLSSEDLGQLGALNNLAWLSLNWINADVERPYRGPPLLSGLPSLRRLETLDLHSCWNVNDRDIRCLAALPRLKSLNVSCTEVSGPGLASLHLVKSLEELSVSGDNVTVAVLQSLLANMHFKKLHIHNDMTSSGRARLALGNGDEVDISRSEIDGCKRVLAELRRSKREIVIDRDDDALEWSEERMMPSEYDTPSGMHALARAILKDWKRRNKGL